MAAAAQTLIPAPGAWNFACLDWESRLRACTSLVPKLPLNDNRAARGLAVFEKFRLPDVEDKPSLGEACGEWFKDIVRVAFGSLDDDGVRHVPEIFALVGKKNSKTTNSAGLMLDILLMNTVPRAEILFVGPTQETADEAFRIVQGMIEEDPEGYLQKRFHVRDHLKIIVDRKTKARIKIKTFSLAVMTGSKPLVVLIDELHILGAIHYASRVMRQIRGALVRRPDSLLVIISTMSDGPPAGCFKAELDYARGVRDGKIPSGRMLPLLWEFPEAIQKDETRLWEDPRMWPMVMPYLGRSIHLAGLIADWEAERAKGTENIQLWASQHLNVQFGIGMHGERWRGTDYWESAEEDLTLDEFLARVEVVTAGVDGGGLDDLMGLYLIGRDRATQDWLGWGRAWAHTDVLERRKDIAERLEDFRRAGDLVLCEHPRQDVEDIADIIERVRMEGLLAKRAGVGLDPVGISDLVDELATRKIMTEAEDGPVCAVFQGYRLSSSVWGMERRLKDRTFRPASQGLMQWCVGNARVESRGNAVLVTKQAAGRAKIDPLIAGFNAYALMSRNPVAGVKPTKVFAGVDMSRVLVDMHATA